MNCPDPYSFFFLENGKGYHLKTRFFLFESPAEPRNPWERREKRSIGKEDQGPEAVPAQHNKYGFGTFASLCR